MPRRKRIQFVKSQLDRESLLNRISTRIRQSLELQEILTTTVREICCFLDADRVKVYWFYPDGSGKVVAESIKENCLPSLMGLRFPAEDIPEEARQMFLKARQRVLVDVMSGKTTINQLDSSNTGQTLLKEDIRYRAVHPCHQEYLKAMGVGSSLVLPILHQNSLWGLLVSHNVEARSFQERELQIVQLLVDQLSIAIAQSELLQTARQQAYHEASINQISTLLHSRLQVTQIRQLVLAEIVQLLHASGGRFYITAEPTGQSAQLYTYGDNPLTDNCIEETALWQKIMNAVGNDFATSLQDKEAGMQTWEFTTPVAQIKQKNASSTPSDSDSSIHHNNLIPQLYTISNLYQEPQLKPFYSAFNQTSILSILIVPLQYHQQCVGCLTLFRNEIETETLWAGKINPDERNLRPRESFEAWREVVKGKAKTWLLEELKLAQALGIHLYMGVMQKRVENTIRHQASHDLLTGLPNRQLFNERLSFSLAQRQQQQDMLAVVFLDLDSFKTINDTLGHAVGDELLQSVAGRLQNCLREGDTISRWGGDEFTLLLSPVVSVEEVRKIAERMLGVMKMPFNLGGHELYVKASLGIALAPYDGEDANTLLKNADAAMYRAKQQGRNNYQLYTSTIGSKAFERLLLQNYLHKALEKEELLLHYQPQLDLETGKITGMEALIRWQHPECGLVPPDRFIPLAEETGLINPIGEWVLHMACAQNKLWQVMGKSPITIAVNLSARQFQENNLVETITRALKQTGLEPKYLEIEITESLVMQDVNLTISVLKTLREMGIKVAIDDFGTGYSSLSSLKHLPLDSLKIDRSFVRDVVTDLNDAAIVKVVVALGHGLGLKVIAEGVETEDQINFLRWVGCDKIQGYWFSRPLPVEAATQLVLNI